jgi:methylmalonyl-CoA carboxyltransferase large subunit
MTDKKTEEDLLSLIAQMRAEIGTLSRRVNELERRQGASERAVSAEIGEETLLAISAAVAAFLGVRARIRQVRVVHSSAWAQVGRVGAHASHRLN